MVDEFGLRRGGSLLVVGEQLLHLRLGVGEIGLQLLIFLRGCGLQESAYEGLWREDFHRRRVGIAIVFQIDSDERVAFVL